LQPAVYCFSNALREGTAIHAVLREADSLAPRGLARRVQECDAVMALRARLRAPGAEWVRNSARATGVPIFSLRTPSDATLVKARHPDPAPAVSLLTASWQALAGVELSPPVGLV